MFETPSLPLALFDFLPVILFALGGWSLACAAGAMRRGHWSQVILLATLLVSMGGAAKAAAKLAMACGLPELAVLGELHFALQAPGFLLLAAAALALPRSPLNRAALPYPLAVMAPWKMPLVIVMALSGAALHALLGSIAWRRGLKPAAACFALALLCLLAMGAAAGGDQSIARQWVEEGTNSLGQLGFLLGSLSLQRHTARGFPPGRA